MLLKYNVYLLHVMCRCISVLQLHADHFVPLLLSEKNSLMKSLPREQESTLAQALTCKFFSQCSLRMRVHSSTKFTTATKTTTTEWYKRRYRPFASRLLTISYADMVWSIFLQFFPLRRSPSLHYGQSAALPLLGGIFL